MNTWDKCKNCGGERGLHHYETDQCPVGGREAPIGKKQEWKSTTFEIEIEETEIVDLEKVALKAMLKEIEFEVDSQTCPSCGGRKMHDSACVLAAFLYPEKAEINIIHAIRTSTKWFGVSAMMSGSHFCAANYP